MLITFLNVYLSIEPIDFAEYSEPVIRPNPDFNSEYIAIYESDYRDPEDVVYVFDPGLFQNLFDD